MDFLNRMDIVHHAVYAPVVAYMAFAGAAELWATGQWDTPTKRFTSRSPASRRFIFLYFCHSVLHSAVSCAKSGPASYKLCMVAHHMVSSALFLGGVDGGGSGHFWAVMDGLCEITGVFLNNVYLFKLLGVSHRTLLATNGACLWLSWIVFRLCLFPAWLWLYISDRYGPEWPSISAALPPFVAALHRTAIPLVATVLLLALSLHWFAPIHRGFVKALARAL